MAFREVRIKPASRCLHSSLISPKAILAVLCVHVTETFIGQQKFKGLTQGPDNGHPLLLPEGKDSGIFMQETSAIPILSAIS